MNGFYCPVALTEHQDVSPYGLLEMLWMAPAILEGIRTEVWLKDTITPVYTLWVNFGLIEDGKLSDAGRRMCSLEGLFEYEIGMVQQQLIGDTTTDPAQYAKLRQGLAAYTDNYLDRFTDFLGSALPANGYMVDLAGGVGALTSQVLEKRPDVSALVIDKAHAFPETPRKFFAKRDILAGSWEGEVKGADLILISEFLHCLDADHRYQVYEKLVTVISGNTRVVIIEQFPNFRLDWRLRDMSTHSGRCLNQQELLNELAIHLPFVATEVRVMQTSTHYALMLTMQLIKD